MKQLVKLACFISWMLCSIGGVSAQQNSRLQWMSLPEAELAFKKEKKPILIDLYTNWCGWCKVMDKKTYSNKNVIKYLQENFYTVKLNAETKDDITWTNRQFHYNTASQTNEIALYLTQGMLSYPTTVIITGFDVPPQAIPGYLTTKEMEILLKYFGEHQFGYISFQEYSKRFKHGWK